jgi:GNAT superfamily N-acetyltransferase
VRLTASGRREHALLDRRSDRLAWSLVEPLDARRRDQLVGAMMTVERLLTASAVRVRIEDPTSPEARGCLEAYVAELGRRFEGGFDPHRSIPADAADLVEPRGVLLVAGLWGEPVGCGGLKLHGAQPAEIKRMWVSRAARGLGVGRRLLTELEQHAARRGVSTLRLETNGALTEAISLYRSAGYHEVAAFNDEVYADHWFEKHLDVGA